MPKDILEDSWVYQETKLKAELATLRKSIVNFVQARFPAMLDITKQKIDVIEDEDTLQRLLLQIGLSQNIEEALQALLDTTK